MADLPFILENSIVDMAAFNNQHAGMYLNLVNLFNQRNVAMYNVYNQMHGYCTYIFTIPKYYQIIKRKVQFIIRETQ